MSERPIHRIRLFLLLGCLSASGPGAMDMYLPALPEISDELGVSTSETQLTIALFLVGLGVGQLVLGPLSDVYGRRRPLLGGVMLFVVASIACAATSSIIALTTARFVQGVGAATGIVISRAIIRDLYGGAAAARAYSRLVLVYGLAPILAPLLGAQILHFTSWRGIFVVVTAFAALLLGAAILWLPETLPPRRRRRAGPRETARGFAFLIRDSRFVGYALTLSFSTGAFVAYIAATPFVTQEIYGASPQLFALLFGANAIGMVGMSQLNAHLVRTTSPRRLLAIGITAALVFSITLLVIVSSGLGLAWFAGCTLLLTATWGLIQPNAVALALADHRDLAGTGSALLGVSQYSMAALTTPLVGLAGSDTAVPLGIATTACAIAACVAVFGLAFRRMKVQTPVATAAHVSAD